MRMSSTLSLLETNMMLPYDIRLRSQCVAQEEALLLIERDRNGFDFHGDSERRHSYETCT